jgi:hypothetical protein
MGTIPILMVQWTYQWDHNYLKPNFQCLRFAADEARPYQNWYGDDLDSYQALLDEGYAFLAARVPGSKVSLVGGQWRRILNERSAPITDINLYQEDHFHPAAIGTYFNAMILVRDIFSVDLKHLDQHPPELSETQFNYLKKQLAQ